MGKKLFLRPILVAFIWGAMTLSVLAGISQSDWINAGGNASLADFAAKVSASEGNWTSLNQYGCAGAFQFCPSTLKQYYSGTTQQFLNDPSAQVAAWTKFQTDQWALAQKNGLTSVVGQEVCNSTGRCATITQSGVLMACQFGCGSKGDLAQFVANGYKCDGPHGSGRDGNGVCVGDYLIKGSGYDVSAITNLAADASGAYVYGSDVSNPCDIGNPESFQNELNNAYQ